MQKNLFLSKDINSLIFDFFILNIAKISFQFWNYSYILGNSVLLEFLFKFTHEKIGNEKWQWIINRWPQLFYKWFAFNLQTIISHTYFGIDTNLLVLQSMLLRNFHKLLNILEMYCNGMIKRIERRIYFTNSG